MTQWDLIRPLIRNEIWTDGKFTLNKCLICAFFSRFAYEELPEDKNSPLGRFKVIPSLTYFFKLWKRRGEDPNPIQIARRLEIENFFIIRRPLVIVIGFKVGSVIFIAIRGTIFLNSSDWKININSFKVGDGVGKFHSGFYRAIAECTSEIKEELKKIPDALKVPIIVTGHSLGGAMAAIFHSHYGISYRRNNPKKIFTYECYTFGMPRYGNVNVVTNLPTPHHVLNKFDLIPTLPPRWLGFSEPLYEYILSIDVFFRNKFYPMVARRYFSIPVTLSRALIAPPIVSHFIGKYYKRISKLVDPKWDNKLPLYKK